MKIRDIYLDGEYVKHNPTWDVEDSPWKADLIFRMIQKHKLNPVTICEVGCGSGEILSRLEKIMPDPVNFTGYEISPAAFELCQKRKTDRTHFMLGDFTEDNDRSCDLILIIDLIEHLEDCFQFLRAIKPRSTYKILHVPLEMFVLSVLYQHFLLGQWKKVGHLHFFSKDLVLQLLNDTGYEIVDFTYTAGYALSREFGIKNKILKVPRRLLFPLGQDFTVKVFGGYSLLVLVK
jgi:SAM-dependent methyltransferase